MDLEYRLLFSQITPLVPVFFIYNMYDLQKKEIKKIQGRCKGTWHPRRPLSSAHTNRFRKLTYEIRNLTFHV